MASHNRASIIDTEDPGYRQAALNIFARYQGPSSEDARPKLGWDPLPVTGTSAKYASI
ncbi:hypothetical protein [Nocardia miyunensis]|uniref:hypothetical protein n=1 Tax=Nocardia miyunensis TaxID=282684 RepID=UPI000B0678D5|nr:hypothetical protein [Nocardia miyunensis]